ncbi:19469_t:CDS:2 [Rhizophagus irregularis]|nr:19469_t:CDS:2 [Rhizophagus irregularis]
MTTLDRSFLETWPEIKNKLNNKFKGRTPQWFKKLEADVSKDFDSAVGWADK